MPSPWLIAPYGLGMQILLHTLRPFISSFSPIFCATSALSRVLQAAIAAPGKGILAADESPGTIAKRFAGIEVENTEENRRYYRELLFTTAGLGEYVSGAICYEETLFHATSDGTPFVEVLRKQGIIPGIKVDKGTVEIPGTAGETATQGLDDLHKRCQKYYAAGARFAKWCVPACCSPCPVLSPAASPAPCYVFYVCPPLMLCIRPSALSPSTCSFCSPPLYPLPVPLSSASAGAL